MVIVNRMGKGLVSMGVTEEIKATYLQMILLSPGLYSCGQRFPRR